MPIIETPHHDLPLSQGDILRGISLFATPKSWLHEEVTAKRTPHSLCLVLSRPCNVQHKAAIVVAAVERFSDSIPKEIESFDEMLDFLSAMRDGERSPDVFYLGQLPRMPGRYCCRFDALFTIEIPATENEHKTILQNHRIGRLSSEFIRDLHLRLFRAIASLGFDDHNWLPTADLDLLVSMGKTDILKLEQKLQEATTAKLAKDAKGETVSKGLLDQIAKLQEDVDRCRQNIVPYERESAFRSERNDAK